jgi:hypothetical protein
MLGELLDQPCHQRLAAEEQVAAGLLERAQSEVRTDGVDQLGRLLGVELGERRVAARPAGALERRRPVVEQPLDAPPLVVAVEHDPGRRAAPHEVLGGVPQRRGLAGLAPQLAEPGLDRAQLGERREGGAGNGVNRLRHRSP